MIQPELNKSFCAEEIADFVLENDNEGLFKSAKLNREEFINAIQRMDKECQVIVFRRQDILWGVLGWIFVTEENKHLVSKQIWRLPDNIIDGDILYLSFIATKGNCDVLAVKKLFEDMGYRKRITKRRGFTKGKWYEKRIFKGESDAN